MKALMSVISSPNRKQNLDIFHELGQYFDLIHDENELEHTRIHEDLLVSTYAVENAMTKTHISRNPHIGRTGGEPLYLNWAEYPSCLLMILNTKYFFRRFKKKELLRCLEDAKVQSYSRGDVIYLNDRIGVLVSGSAYVKKHFGDDLCNPITKLKMTEGHILGFAEGEETGGLTTDHLAWVTTHGIQTEILWFNKADFMKLWYLQLDDVDMQISIQTISTHPIFAHMSLISKSFLVYESMK